MQYSTGTISVEQTNPVVTGSGTVDWSEVTTNDLLVVAGQVYEIVTVDAPGKTITISIPYPGATNSAIAYVIARDFTSSHNLPLLNPGDLEAPSLFSRAMALIDAKLSVVGSSSAGANDVTISKAAHGFIVGNVLTYTAGVWDYCKSSVAANQTPVGVVAEVIDDGTFVVRFSGIVGTSGTIAQPIAGITMTAGTVYVVRTVPTTGGGGQINLVPSGDVNMGPVELPIMMAASSNTAYLLPFAVATSGLYGQDAQGQVPGYTAGQIGYYLGTSGWQAAAVSNASVDASKLLSGGLVDWTAFLAGGAGSSVLTHMADLRSRLEVIETARALGGYVNNLQVWPPNNMPQISSTPISAFTWAIPAGVDFFELIMDYRRIYGTINQSDSPAGDQTTAYNERVALGERGAMHVGISVPTGASTVTMWAHLDQGVFVALDNLPLASISRGANTLAVNTVWTTYFKPYVGLTYSWPSSWPDQEGINDANRTNVNYWSWGYNSSLGRVIDWFPQLPVAALYRPAWTDYNHWEIHPPFMAELRY